MLRIQEVIYDIKSDMIVETGVAHGGSLVVYASLCTAIGKGRVTWARPLSPQELAKAGSWDRKALRKAPRWSVNGWPTSSRTGRLLSSDGP